jgi:nucleotide-binding universal stress UspA family protein
MRRTPMIMFMLAAEPGGSAEQPHPRLIIVGVDDSAEAEAAAKWAVREAELRKDDVLLVHAYEVPLLPSSGRAAAIAQGRQERQDLLDKVAATLAVPPRMHLDQLIEIDSPESLLPRLSENAELTVLGQDHRALSGQMPLGHTASTVASMTRHPVVAVPRGWTAPAGDRRPIAVAIDGLHPSSSTLGFAFTEASLRQVPVVVVHSAPLSELAMGEQNTRLNLAEILAGWKADYPDIEVETFLLAGPPRDTVALTSADAQTARCWCSLPRPGVYALDTFRSARRARSCHLSGRRYPPGTPSLSDSGLGLSPAWSPSMALGWSPTVADHPPSGHMLARQPYEHVSVTSGPRLGKPPEPHLSEVVYGGQLQAPNDDHTPTRLEELIGLVDLESTNGAECMVEDLAVGNRTKDDGVVDKDVVHGQDPRAGISGVGDSAHGLGGE